jgi:hypothetical protein
MRISAISVGTARPAVVALITTLHYVTANGYECNRLCLYRTGQLLARANAEPWNPTVNRRQTEKPL